MQEFLSAARALIACPHPYEQVQTFAIDKPVPEAAFPPRRITINRCQQCGAVRMRGDDWIAPLGVTTLTAVLGVFCVVTPTLVALAEQWRQAQDAGWAFATSWHPAASDGDLVQPVDEIPLADLFAYDCAASGCVPPQLGVPVHAPHLRTLLAAYMAVQIAAVAVLQAEAEARFDAETNPSGVESAVRRPRSMRG